MDWSQFTIQLIATLTPVVLAILKQNRRIASLESANSELHRENQALKKDLHQLRTDYESLQSRYEANLEKQAGMRDRF